MKTKQRGRRFEEREKNTEKMQVEGESNYANVLREMIGDPRERGSNENGGRRRNEGESERALREERGEKRGGEIRGGVLVCQWGQTESGISLLLKNRQSGSVKVGPRQILMEDHSIDLFDEVDEESMCIKNSLQGLIISIKKKSEGLWERLYKTKSARVRIETDWSKFNVSQKERECEQENHQKKLIENFNYYWLKSAVERSQREDKGEKNAFVESYREHQKLKQEQKIGAVKNWTSKIDYVVKKVTEILMTFLIVSYYGIFLTNPAAANSLGFLIPILVFVMKVFDELRFTWDKIALCIKNLFYASIIVMSSQKKDFLTGFLICQIQFLMLFLERDEGEKERFGDAVRERIHQYLDQLCVKNLSAHLETVSGICELIILFRSLFFSQSVHLSLAPISLLFFCLALWVRNVRRFKKAAHTN